MHCLVNPGLSPLARGTLFFKFYIIIFGRFIPAGAGNTMFSLFANDDGSVYPRWRGEHSPFRASHLTRPGLSPLARGTPFPHPGAYSQFRFIPAGAGNTYYCATRDSRRAVYPRWRGEHFTQVNPFIVRTGLSPLARGTLIFCDASMIPYRFIPAGAGNTLTHIAFSPAVAVYPRWRGEHNTHKRCGAS